MTEQTQQKAPLMGCLDCGELTFETEICPRCKSKDLIGLLEPTNAAENLATIRAENWE